MDKIELIKQYKKKIESELEGICDDILIIIQKELIPNSDSEEGKVRGCGWAGWLDGREEGWPVGK